jgi:tetraacyldisaccharide-1-P 4'-kinase
LPDHVAPRQQELEAFAATCKERGADLLLCTEKDWVKLPVENNKYLPIIPVKVRLQIIAGQEHWDKTIQSIQEKIRERS